jgi:hypothetical protein
LPDGSAEFHAARDPGAVLPMDRRPRRTSCADGVRPTLTQRRQIGETPRDGRFR